MDYLSNEWILDKASKDYILQMLEDVFTMLQPANRNAPDLEQRITEKAVQFVNFLPVENRRGVFQFLPVNVQRGILWSMLEKDQAICLRNCTSENNERFYNVTLKMFETESWQKLRTIQYNSQHGVSAIMLCANMCKVQQSGDLDCAQ